MNSSPLLENEWAPIQETPILTDPPRMLCSALSPQLIFLGRMEGESEIRTGTGYLLVSVIAKVTTNRLGLREHLGGKLTANTANSDIDYVVKNEERKEERKEEGYLLPFGCRSRQTGNARATALKQNLTDKHFQRKPNSTYAWFLSDGKKSFRVKY